MCHSLRQPGDLRALERSAFYERKIGGGNTVPVEEWSRVHESKASLVVLYVVTG
jgi:hypothetical protein